MKRIFNITPLTSIIWLTLISVPTAAFYALLRAVRPDGVWGRRLFPLSCWSGVFAFVVFVGLLYAIKYYFEKVGGPPDVTGDYQRSLKRLDFAKRYMFFPPRDLINIHRMAALVQLGRTDEAKELALQTLQRVNDEADKEFAAALLVLGDIAGINDDLEAAMGYFIRLKEIDGRLQHSALRELALLHMAMEQPDEALKMINECLQLLKNPDYIKKIAGKDQRAQIVTGYAEATKAWVLAEQGYHDGALALLHSGANKVAGASLTSQSTFHLIASRAYQAMNQPADAREQLQRTIEVDPTGYIGRQAREILAEIDRKETDSTTGKESF